MEQEVQQATASYMSQCNVGGNRDVDRAADRLDQAKEALENYEARQAERSQYQRRK